MRVHEAAAVGFERNAGDYEQARPGYPDAAIAFLVSELGLGPGATLVDAAAGTGKLTRLLVPSGARVLAIEPVAGMARALTNTVPGVLVASGMVEAMPLVDGGADAVTAAQAVHWFTPHSVDELARVLRPSGHLAIVQNVRDQTQAVHQAISSLRAHHAAGAPSFASGEWRVPYSRTTHFTPLAMHEFPWTFELPKSELPAHVRSLAPIASLPLPEQHRAVGEITELASAEPDPIALRYVTEVHVCRRR